MLVLAVLSTILIVISKSSIRESDNSKAKRLADQTIIYSKEFAKYLASQRRVLENIVGSNINTIISVDTLKSANYWDNSINEENILKAKPCVSIIKNGNSKEMEAIMFYVSNIDRSNINQSIVRRAVERLGLLGGLYQNGKVQGSSGWGISNANKFLSNIGQCNGGNIPSTSIVINLDLMPEWNNKLLPLTTLNGGIDKNNGYAGKRSNLNTLKSNLYINSSDGLVLDSVNNNKLSVISNIQAGTTAMLGFSNSTTNISLNSIQPNLRIYAGTPCLSGELGNTVLSDGEKNISSLNQYLAKDVLVCSKNAALCTGSGGTCYLSSNTNKVTFNNTIDGVQDSNGKFICPLSVPFLDVSSVAIPQVLEQLKVFQENIKIWYNSQQFIVGCHGFYNCSISGRVYPNMQYFTKDIYFNLSINYISKMVNNYNVTTGFQENPIDTSNINYRSYLDNIIGCNKSSYGEYIDGIDGLKYHYKICYYDGGWLYTMISSITSIQEIQKVGIQPISSVSCSNMVEYSGSY